MAGIHAARLESRRKDKSGSLQLGKEGKEQFTESWTERTNDQDDQAQAANRRKQLNIYTSSRPEPPSRTPINKGASSYRVFLKWWMQQMFIVSAVEPLAADVWEPTPAIQKAGLTLSP